MVHLVLITNFSESKHCPVGSECRALLSKSSCCQTQIILNQFDCDIDPVASKCRCCFKCIDSHSKTRCLECSQFLRKYFPSQVHTRKSKSVKKELKVVLAEFFEEMDVTEKARGRQNSKCCPN